MIVFDLKCGLSGHRFEGWFGSSEEYERQKLGGMLVCPMCGDHAIEKAVMAPAIGAKSNQRAAVRPIENTDADGAIVAPGDKILSMQKGMDPARVAQLMEVLSQAQAKALADSQWVGNRFAAEARAMHYGEEEQRPIHGEVAAEEARSLLEEGVDVAPLLFPVIPPKAQN